MIVFSVAIPCDFSINSDKKEYWHREILQNYYPLKVGETATLKNASCGLIRKPSEVQTLTSWQKLLLKNEVLWQKNETLVPVPDKTGFKVEKNELKTSIFSDIGPLEITFQHLDIKANDTVFLILDNKSGKFAFPAIPIMNQKGHDFIVFVNKRTLPRFEEYLLYVVNVNKKTVYLLPDTCKTSY